MLTSSVNQGKGAASTAPSQNKNTSHRQISTPRNSVQPSDIARAAEGRWPEIFVGLGGDPETLTGRHTYCQGCGGKDRFRFDDKNGRGTYICGGGGNPTSGDGFDMLSHIFGWSASQAFQAVARFLGIDVKGEAPEPRQQPPATPKPRSEDPPKRTTADYALELWASAARTDRIVGSHPYALSKGIDWAAGAGRGNASGIEIGKRADCLLIPVRDIRTDAVCAVQAINPAGVKQSFGPIRGNAFICGSTLGKRAPWFVVEGWADAVSIVFHAHKGNAAAFACMGHHFDIVAQTVAEHFAPPRLVVLEDAA